MMFLGSAALGALDLLSSLTSQLEAKAGSKSDASGNGANFANALGASSDSTGATQAAVSDAPGVSAGSGPFKPNVLAFLLARQEQQSGTQGRGPDGLSPLGEALFAKLDGDGNGSISKAELQSALGTGTDSSAADKLFSKLDKSGDGALDAKEFAGALRGRGGHHRHGPPPAERTQDLAALLDAQSQGASSSTTTNADGSSTTTITYADGSKVSLTTPAAAAETGSAAVQPSAGTHNILETLIQLQAQHIGGGTAGTTAAGSAAA
jgi:hypothetical protein